jgi:subtilisin family serine protease
MICEASLVFIAETFEIAPSIHQKRDTSAMRIVGLLCMALLASVASAQIRLNVPSLGGVLPTPLTPQLGSLETQSERTLGELRRLQITALYRTHRDVVDRDAEGEPVVRGVVLALNPTSTALEQARSMGFTLLREQLIDVVDLRVSVLGAPREWSTRKALERLRRADSAGSYDYDHIYLTVGAVESPERSIPQTGEEQSMAAAAVIRIGMLDAGIDTSHPSLRAAQVRSWGCGDRRVPSAHGTAIASLLVGEDGSFRGVAPGSRLFAADVYCGEATGGSLDALIGALAWLVPQRVSVINMSLVGARNRLLEQAIARLLAQGFTIVAAVGNDGPAAPPLYPASYPGVIGVTAVDAHNRVLLEAARGAQVMFAAPGADLAAADLAGRYAAVRGTSFAAPFVTGLLALAITQPDPQQAAAALQALQHSAVHLGSAGRNLTYGFGLIGAQWRIEPVAVSSQR